MENCLTKSITPLLLLSVCSFITTGTARAGEWVLDHYEINGESTKKAFDGRQGPPTAAGTTKDVYEWSNQHQEITRWINGKLYSLYSEEGYPPTYGDEAYITWDGYGLNGFAPQTVFLNYSSRAIFRWKRSLIPNTETPDPDDNPPEYCWIYESAVLSGTQYAVGMTGLAWDATPYTDTESSFSDVEFPFAKYSPSLLVANSSPDDNNPQSPQVKRADFTMRDSQVIGLKTLKNQDIAIGPNRTFKGTINQHTFLTSKHAQGQSNLYWGYSASPAKFNVLSRRKEDHDPNDLVTNFSSQSSVLAGGNVTDLRDHEADIVLELPGAGNAKMKHIPFIEKINPEGVSIPVKLLPTDATYTGTLNNGRAPIGIVRSRDKIDATKGAWIAANKSWSNPTLINHDWGQVTWKMGVNGDKPWSTNFPNANGETTEEGYKEWIWATIKDGTKPLKDHTMKFIAKRVVVTVADENTEEAVTKIFTTDMNESGTNVTKAEDIDALVAPYITLPPAQVAGAGIYKGQLLVKKNPDFVVESFRLGLQDQGVYIRRN